MKMENQEELVEYLPNLAENATENRTAEKIQNSDLKLTQESLIGLIVLYSVTTLLAIVGNVFVIIVFSKGRRSRTDLRLFLINLAVADLLMAIFCMPITFADTVSGMWIFSEPLCPIVLFIQLLSVVASVSTNVAIGIDRFLGITFPLNVRFTQERWRLILISIWLFSATLASVQFWVARTYETESGSLSCNEIWPSRTYRRIYTIFILLFTYVIPLIVLTVTYSIVGFLLWKRTSPGNRHRTRDYLMWRSKIKIVKMLVTVVAMFGLCWLPIHAFTMATDFFPEILDYSSPQEEKLFIGLFLSAHWLAMSNSFANPIIYGFTNDNFRMDLVTIFYMWFPCCGCLGRVIRRTNSASTQESIIFRRSFLRRSVNGNTSKRIENVTSYGVFHRKDLSFEWFVALFVIYSLTTILSVFGNILVIIVFTRGRRSRTELRPFLINLALADLIMAVFCMPFTFAHTIYPMWLFSVPMCPIVLFMQLLSVVSSVFINVAIGVDRFLVVIYPLKSKSLQQKSKYVLIAIWIISIAISSVEIPIARTSPGKGSSIVCGEKWPEPSLKSKRDFTLVLFIVTYAIPLLILVVAYTVVGYILWKRTTPGNRDELRDIQQLRSKVKVVKMLILVVTMFGICWLPLHVFNLVVDFNPELLKKEKETLLAVPNINVVSMLSVLYLLEVFYSKTPQYNYTGHALDLKT
ncbi:hypothetical protein KUTeg_003670 [Tegillarca granosa]|uniref:G-protein coupled receptors family 1 profile domain-containing protein n=1 Tax=Tegillarca granosa TaxID=220873 RepID=A0ABQ9FMR6_TEGGR|nr:hypothetical protein KUTeg_003670 [Tegillarca granosa]